MFSLEMSEEMVRALLTVGESAQEAERLCSENVVIDDTPGITVDTIGSLCRIEKADRGLDLVVIEYMQLISREKRDAESYGKILKELKSLAEELDCSMLVEAQLPRSVDVREDHRPVISDFFNAQAVSDYVDNVLFLYREGYYTKEPSGETELIIAK